MLENIDKMGYSEFCVAISEDTSNRFRVVLEFEDFQIWSVDGVRYFYLETDENDASDFYELELVASLNYDISHLWNDSAENCKMLADLFDNDYCGEVVSDDEIRFLWFKRKQKED